MATSLTTGPTKVSLQGTLTQARSGLPSLSDGAAFTYTGPELAPGLGAGAADTRYLVQATIAASGTLATTVSSLLDSFGNSIAFLRLKEIYVELTTGTNAVSILVGAGTDPIINYLVGTTPQVRVRNGMCFYLGCCADAVGYAVTPSTADQLKLTNEDSGLSAIVNLWLIGCSG